MLLEKISTSNNEVLETKIYKKCKFSEKVNRFLVLDQLKSEIIKLKTLAIVNRIREV